MTLSSLMNRRLALPALAALAFALGLAAFVIQFAGRAIPGESPRDFSLKDLAGVEVNGQNLRGHWSLVFFGYTHCPDVCPTTLSTVSAVLAKLKPADGRLRGVFVTLDPERDTPPLLTDYLANFDPAIVAWRGTPAQTAMAAKAFNIFYEKRPDNDGGYSVDHTSVLLLIDPSARTAAVFPFTIQPETLSAELAERMDRSRP